MSIVCASDVADNSSSDDIASYDNSADESNIEHTNTTQKEDYNTTTSKNLSNSKLSGNAYTLDDLKNEINIAKSVNGASYTINVLSPISMFYERIDWSDSNYVRNLTINGNYNYLTLKQSLITVNIGYTLNIKQFYITSQNNNTSVILNYPGFVNSGNLSFDRCNFKDCYANYAGCIYNTAGYFSNIPTLNITNTIFTNSSSINGGCINANNTRINMKNITVEKTNATRNGGFIYLNSSVANITDIYFRALSAITGGALYLERNSRCYIDKIFAYNITAITSGFAYVEGGLVSINNANIYDIKTVTSASFIRSTGDIILNNTWIHNTTGESLLTVYNKSILINNSGINNHTQSYLIYNENGNTSILNSIISNNNMHSLLIIKGNITIHNSSIYNNTNRYLIRAYETINLNHNQFLNNTASNMLIYAGITSKLLVYSNRFTNNINPNSTLLFSANNNYTVYNNTYINNYLKAYIIPTYTNIQIKEESNITNTYPIIVRYDNIYNATINVPLNVYIDDKIYDVIESNNGLKIRPDIIPGTHKIRLTKNNYQAAMEEATINITIEKKSVQIQTTTKQENNKLKLNITLKTISNKVIPEKTVLININNKNYQRTTDNNGKINFEATLNAGLNTINIITPNSGVYQLNSTTLTIYKRENTTTTVQPIKANYNDTITLTATVKTKNNTLLNEGYVIFKVNGITLKDSKNKTLQVAITDYKAEVKYHIRLDKANYTATYLTNDKYTTSTSTSTINITRIRPQLQILTGNSVYKAGDTVIFQTLVTYNGKTINNGQLNYKLNGITIKDAKGVPIKVNVTQGVATLKYTIPKGFLATNYTLTAVFGGSIYNRSEVNSSVRVVKTGTYIQTTPIRTSKNTATLTARIYDTSNTLTTTKTSCVIKIDGATIKRLNVTNGVINVEINTNYLKGIHTIEIIAGENHAYQMSKTTTYLIKE